VLAHFLSPTRARAAIFVVMVVVLMLRPQGLFGAKER
jgi:branched-subunit amino acid ABC-type transport system permease component